jgi:hypothetical protein
MAGATEQVESERESERDIEAPVFVQLTSVNFIFLLWESYLDWIFCGLLNLDHISVYLH